MCFLLYVLHIKIINPNAFMCPQSATQYVQLKHVYITFTDCNFRYCC